MFSSSWEKCERCDNNQRARMRPFDAFESTQQLAVGRSAREHRRAGAGMKTTERGICMGEGRKRFVDNGLGRYTPARKMPGS